MRYTVYVKERLGQLLLVGGVTATMEIFLLILRAAEGLQIYTAFCAFGVYFLISWGEYRRKKHYFSRLEESLSGLDKKYLLPEMLDPPCCQEERLMREVFRDLEHSMADHVNYYKNAEKEYKEYIELWIHEVKTPIAAGKLMVENHRDALSGDLEEELGKIEAYTEQALFYARSAHVEKDYLIRPVSLKDLVTQAVKRHKKALIGRKAGIHMEGLDLTVYSDERWLAFMLGQILSNSIKYCDKEALELHFAGTSEKERICLSIRDNGRGVPEEDLERIFEKGFTGSRERIRSQATGLGLYLCRKLCGRLGHGIQAVSKEGEGLEIRIYFPKGSYTQV